MVATEWESNGVSRLGLNRGAALLETVHHTPTFTNRQDVLPDILARSNLPVSTPPQGKCQLSTKDPFKCEQRDVLCF